MKTDTSGAPLHGTELEPERGPQSPYLAQLLLEEEVAPEDLDCTRLLASVRRALGEVVPLETHTRTFGFIHPNHVGDHSAGPIPPVTFVTPVATWSFARAPAVKAAADQTWDWIEAPAVVRGCRSMVLVSDMLAGALDRRLRLDLFHGVVSAVLEHLPVAAIHWIPSQRIIKPRAYAARLAQGKKLVAAPVNVRLYKVDDGRSDERVMDTRGLEAFGLPDLQCHFSGLDPADVSAMLYRQAELLFEHGDVPEAWTGEWIEAKKPALLNTWSWRPTRSMVAPHRRVIELRPDRS